jgi:hypothetical protein
MRQARVCEPSGEIDHLLRCAERLGANRTSPPSAALSRHGVNSLVVAPLLSCSALSRGVRINLLIQAQHPLDLSRRGTPGRRAR